MLLIFGGLVGLAAGLAAGGRLGRLGEVRFRWPVVVLLALLVKELGVESPLAHSAAAPLLYTLALAALAAWTAWHRDVIPGIVVVAAGMAMNLVVVAANLGRMPVSRELARRGPPDLIRNGVLGQYVLAGSHTRLDLLGDWIQLPGTLGRVFPQAYSPGDLVATVGMGVAVFLTVKPLR